MRVIAGKAGSLPLRTIEGVQTRPTTDRIKETLFNILGPRLAECRFLDLFSGSGAIGIEALSRGAAQATFVENNRRACTCIRQNLSFTKLADDGKILCMDVLQALRVLEGEPPFHIVFMDPPYGKGLWIPVLDKLSSGTLICSDSLIVIEEALDTDFSPASEMGFRISRIKRYKTNQHVFLLQEE